MSVRQSSRALKGPSVKRECHLSPSLGLKFLLTQELLREKRKSLNMGAAGERGGQKDIRKNRCGLWRKKETE